MKRARRSVRGLTLIEVMVAAAISMILSIAAFMFAANQTRAMGLSNNSLNMGQAGRTTMDLLVEDVRNAGVGVGYQPDGAFSGLIQGTYTGAGGAGFNSRNSMITVGGLTIPTDDLAIRTADGNYATIADWSLAGTGQICSGSGLTAGELVVARTDDALASRTVSITGITAGTGCTTGNCLGGCDSITWAANSAYLSETGATNLSYLGGELSSGFKTIVWFVEATDPSRAGVGALRRAIFDATRTCSTRNHTCGDLIAEGIDTLQIQVWEWDPTNNRWSNVTTATPSPYSRLRVDIEMVVRARQEDDHYYDRTNLRLEPGTCLPTCSGIDKYQRKAIRGSAEIKNSGRTRIR